MKKYSTKEYKTSGVIMMVAGALMFIITLLGNNENKTVFLGVGVVIFATGLIFFSNKENTKL